MDPQASSTARAWWPEVEGVGRGHLPWRAPHVVHGTRADTVHARQFNSPAFICLSFVFFFHDLVVMCGGLCLFRGWLHHDGTKSCCRSEKSSLILLLQQRGGRDGKKG